MKRVLALFALLLILTISSSAVSSAVTLEPVRITVTTSTPNTTTGATLKIDLLTSSGSAFDVAPVSIVREGVKTNLGGVLSFVLDEEAWSAPEYNPDYLVRITYDGVVLSIERLEVVYAKQGLYGALITQDKIDPTSLASIFIPANFLSTLTFTSDGNFTIPAGVHKITIEAVGGAGGGGGSGADMTSGTSSTTGATGGGGAGGAGEYAGMFLDVTAGDVISVTIGSAGTAGTLGASSTSPGNGVNGGNGGNTIVQLNSTTILTANGGSGGGGSLGNSSTTAGGAGGALGAGGTGSSALRHTNGTDGGAGTAASNTTTYGPKGSGVKGLSATGVINNNKGGDGGNGVYSGTGKKDGLAGLVGVAGHVVITYYQD